MQRFDLPALAREKNPRAKTLTLRPIDPSSAVVLDFLQAGSRVVGDGYKHYRDIGADIVARARRAYHADDADTIATYIASLRAQLDRSASTARRAIEEATIAEGRRHTQRWTAAIGSGANIDVSLLVQDRDLIDLLSIRVQEHASLIRSLANDVADRIERLALGSVLEGTSNRETAKALSELEGISRRRAQLIARDQASKLNGAMNQFRQEQAGVTHYKWSTTIDGRERPDHHARNGRVFAWNTPPSDGHPGRAINCRCRALAVLIDDDAEARSVTPGPDVEGVAIVPDNAALISRVGRTINEPILTWAREQLLVRKVEIEDVRALLTLIQGTAKEVENEFVRFFAKMYGYEPDLAEIDRSRRSRTRVLRSAIRERLDLSRDIIEHALSGF